MLKISNRQQALEEICNKFTDEFRVLLLYYSLLRNYTNNHSETIRLRLVLCVHVCM